MLWVRVERERGLFGVVQGVGWGGPCGSEGRIRDKMVLLGVTDF